MPEEVKDEMVELLGCNRDEIIGASGKTGKGVDELLAAIIDRRPASNGRSRSHHFRHSFSIASLISLEELSPTSES